MRFPMQPLAFLLPAVAIAAPILESHLASIDTTVALGEPVLAGRDAPKILPRQGFGSVTATAGLAYYHRDADTVGTSGKSDPSSYTCYSGPASNFPDQSEWINFDAMWKLQVASALTPIGDTPSQIAAIHLAIKKIAASADVDPRVILGVIINESTGNVHVGCTNNGVVNCGIMQTHDPVVQYFDPTHPVHSIIQMVRDGVQGTINGAGLVQLFNDEALTGGNLWNVLRAYNSGSVNLENLSDPVGATAHYVSNVANYVTGWNGWGEGPAACGFAN